MASLGRFWFFFKSMDIDFTQFLLSADWVIFSTLTSLGQSNHSPPHGPTSLPSRALQVTLGSFPMWLPEVVNICACWSQEQWTTIPIFTHIYPAVFLPILNCSEIYPCCVRRKCCFNCLVTLTFSIPRTIGLWFITSEFWYISPWRSLSLCERWNLIVLEDTLHQIASLK